ncbi:MAG: hypothetical protein R3324_02630 [Halobacteriales archaeon]|nr:hypothetical protein [Halobacteriales archaeon]
MSSVEDRIDRLLDEYDEWQPEAEKQALETEDWRTYDTVRMDFMEDALDLLRDVRHRNQRKE